MMSRGLRIMQFVLLPIVALLTEPPLGFSLGELFGRRLLLVSFRSHSWYWPRIHGTWKDFG